MELPILHTGQPVHIQNQGKKEEGRRYEKIEGVKISKGTEDDKVSEETEGIKILESIEDQKL